MYTNFAVSFLLQLLLGIKDIDDSLVSATLICLSELVPILGASTVIGGKRSKFFSDGRPNSKTKPLLPVTNPITETGVYLPSKSLRDLPCSGEIYESDDRNEIIAFDKSLTLNERPSPVGGESIDDEIIATELHTKRDSEDDWSDWENNRHLTTKSASPILDEDNTHEKLVHIKNMDEKGTSTSIEKVLLPTKIVSESRTTLLQKAAIEAKKNILDISELDIKNQKYDSKKNADEFDFFADMTPVIEKPTIVNIAHNSATQNVSSKLEFIPDENVDENEGWGEGWND